MNKQLTKNNALSLTNPNINYDQIFNLLDISDETRRDYKYRITAFITFIQNNGIHVNSFLEYKRSLAQRNDYSISTKNKYLASAKIFLKELNRQGILPMDITQNIKSFRHDKKHKRGGLNTEEITVLSRKLRELPLTPQNARLRAIICLLALQGLRQVELMRIDLKDVDLVAKKALIQGKGRDDKELIDLHPETVKTLKEYIRISHIADGALFYSQSNNHRNRRLTTRSIRKIAKQALEDLGIEKTVHGFRHFFTTTLIKTYKGDLLQVAEYTRHKGLEMLQVYNDAIRKEADLPRYYNAFNEINF